MPSIPGPPATNPPPTTTHLPIRTQITPSTPSTIRTQPSKPTSHTQPNNTLIRTQPSQPTNHLTQPAPPPTTRDRSPRWDHVNLDNAYTGPHQNLFNPNDNPRNPNNNPSASAYSKQTPEYWAASLDKVTNNLSLLLVEGRVSVKNGATHSSILLPARTLQFDTHETFTLTTQSTHPPWTLVYTSFIAQPSTPSWKKTAPSPPPSRPTKVS